MAHEIDEEVRKIMDECHKKAKEILSKNKDLVKLIADALLEYETITKEEIDSLVETGHMPEEKTEEVKKETTKKKEVVEEEK